jgi:hypothetical protein
MKTTFIVTSAVNSRFGVYTPEQRLDMTLQTLQCLRDRVPGCKIVISEVSGDGIAQDMEDQLMDACDVYIDFSTNKEVNVIYTSPTWYNNWDIVKNLTELSTFPQALQTLLDSGEVEGQDRLFKMSGRYLLNDKFDLSVYEQDDVKDKIVIGKKVASQFPYAVTEMSMQYMCRLLSWPASKHADMIEYYKIARNHMVQRVAKGGYSDIEHSLCFSLPPSYVKELEEVGVYGNIAPNGAPIVN